MNKPNLKTILAELAEQAVPGTQIDLWPALQAQLLADAWNPEKGKKLMKNPTSPKNFIRWVALALLAVVIAFSVLLATPQGRAWAEGLLQFFTRAESDTLPLQPFQLTPLPTLAPESTPETPFSLTVEQAQARAGYPVSLPAETKGHNFYGAEYDPARAAVSLNYSDPEIGFGNGFLITEQLLTASPEISPLQGVVGASAPVETVQIGKLEGEYVMGVWQLTDNGPVWDPTPSLQTLRWKTDTTFFELIYQGEKLTKLDLIAIAESLH